MPVLAAKADGCGLVEGGEQSRTAVESTDLRHALSRAMLLRPMMNC
jgi:hypothetical protein